MAINAGFQKRGATLPLVLLFSSLVLPALTGCGTAALTTAIPEQPLVLHGVIHGGQSPVSGATVGLYRVGSSGNGSAATNLLTSTVTSDANGDFSLTGRYTCANASDQVYVAANGGNPGLAPGSTNPALAMMAALGNCGDLTSSTTIQVTEVTTMAAAYALAQFATDLTHIGATATNSVGIQNAMADAKLLADPATGYLTTLPAGQATEGPKLLALADVLSTCVNSDGSAPCTALYANLAPVKGAAPNDTFKAALSIALNPGNNVSQIFGLAPAQPPFPTAMTAAPNDWTMSLTLTSGVYSPTGLGVDSKGNIWVADYYNALSGYTAQGTPIPGSPFSPCCWISEVYTLAIDRNDDVWMTNQETPQHGSTRGTLVKFNGVASGKPGTPVNWYFDNSIDYPDAIATDSNGYIDVANNHSGTFTVYNDAGTLLAGGLGSGGALAYPMAIHPDANHGVWIANNASLPTAPHFAFDGTTATLLSKPTCCSTADGVAVDQGGNAWVTNYLSSSVSEISAAGAVLLNSVSAGGINTPAGVYIDSAQNVWVPNYHGSSVSELAGNYSASPAATALSPAGGFGLDANLLEPYQVAADPSGNLWVSSHGNDRVVMFFGLAAPTKTPVFAAPEAP